MKFDLLRSASIRGDSLRWSLRRVAVAIALPLALVAAAAAQAAAPRDTLTLLVPDDADRGSWQVKVWTDSAAEEGIRLETLTDSQFLALGATAAAKISGLVVPDSAHIKASSAVVAAIKSYAFTGGRLMLVYDAGSLTDTGSYPVTGSSRFSDMVGVDYVLYASLLDKVVGFGPVVGTQARLESLSLPPGKYLPYVPPPSLASVTATTAFVPTSRLDPGGTQLMSAAVQQRGSRGIEDGSDSVRRMRLRALRDALGLDTAVHMPVRYGRRVEAASKSRDEHVKDIVRHADDDVDAVLDGDDAKETGRGRKSTGSSSVSAGTTASVATTSAVAAAAPATTTTLQAISGYAYGPLGYFSYVTTGNFPGTVYLSSPEHGLVAGTRSYGSGQVLFVNLPLGYFKAVGTDSAPLHGFLGLFAREQVGVSTASVQPRGVGGLIYNWHIDDGDDLTSDAKYLLDKTTVFSRGPFSLHFTAGPDVIAFGDGNGMDLAGTSAKSLQAQDLVRRLANVGKYAGKLPVQHEMGSHGGWIHDYWGVVASEANVPDLTSLLAWNFSAIEAVTGRKILEYSSPAGNTPLWALKWLERRGVKAAYTVGDGGAASVRSWRMLDGVVARVADKLWNVPVTPQGLYATFEEFDEFGITDAVSGQWLLDLQSFAVNRRTHRLFYNHPPGARGHLAAINPLLKRADTLQAAGRFRWYTMTQMADFSQRRVEAVWDSTTAAGTRTYTASHPTSLADLTWLLPRSRYAQPRVLAGSGTVSSDSTNWVVTANGGTSLRFSAAEL